MPYALTVVDKTWAPLIVRSLQNGKGSYLQNRFNLYDAMMNNPANTLEPYSTCNDGVPRNDSHWNDPSRVRTNNCYEYACNRDGIPGSFDNPGEGPTVSPYAPPGPIKRGDVIDCATMIARSKADGAVDYNGKCCPSGYHLVYLVVAPGAAGDPGVDYHWYRKDDGGGWSHKRGASSVTTTDASGKNIADPAAADKKYQTHDYKKNCGYLCLPN